MLIIKAIISFTAESYAPIILLWITNLLPVGVLYEKEGIAGWFHCVACLGQSRAIELHRKVGCPCICFCEAAEHDKPHRASCASEGDVCIVFVEHNTNVHHHGYAQISIQRVLLWEHKNSTVCSSHGTLPLSWYTEQVTHTSHRTLFVGPATTTRITLYIGP